MAEQKTEKDRNLPCSCDHEPEAHLRNRHEGLLGTCAVCERQGWSARCQWTRPAISTTEESTVSETLTDTEVARLPINERIQIALHEALGEDDAAHAYDAIESLLAEAFRSGHYCGVNCEKEDAQECVRNPFSSPRRSW